MLLLKPNFLTHVDDVKGCALESLAAGATLEFTTCASQVLVSLRPRPRAGENAAMASAVVHLAPGGPVQVQELHLNGAMRSPRCLQMLADALETNTSVATVSLAGAQQHSPLACHLAERQVAPQTARQLELR